MDKGRKLSFLQEKNLGPADDVRNELKRLEERPLDLLEMSSDQVLALLNDLDRVAAMFAAFDSEAELVAERSRFEGVQARLKKDAPKLLKKLGGESVLRQYRADLPSPGEPWWWYLDQLVARQRQRRVKRMSTIGMIILGILVVLVVLFNTVLKPSPEALARLNAETNAYRALEQEADSEKALAAVDEGLAAVPNEPTLLVIKGSVLQLMNREPEAEAAFALAQEIFNDPIDYHLIRAQVYLRTNQFEQAETEARLAVDLKEDYARSWLLLGQSLEMQEKYFDALQVYDIAGQIASENNENEVYVMSRMALGRLTEALPAMSLEEGIVEPAEE